MLFNSFEFLFAFLPVTLLVHHALARYGGWTLAKVWLVVASLTFYAWWHLAYLPLLAASIVCNYGIGRTLTRLRCDNRRRAAQGLLAVGVASNLALLGWFKYHDFLAANINAALGTDFGMLSVLLPLAISFFTFQQIAFLADCARGEARVTTPLDYALFVSFFPQLIAGPIVQHREVIPQIATPPRMPVEAPMITAGAILLSMGLFKKVVLADTLAIWANGGFDTPLASELLLAWQTGLAYTFQLYFDFSGYSDMALGLALFFAIRLPQNFASPYQATTISEFWSRWHITLSRFLRERLYIPLGGNRLGESRTAFNAGLTFLLGGLWHGAGWNFIFWGALHGAATIVHRLWQRLPGKLPTVVAWMLTFAFVSLAWVPFRADSLGDAMHVFDAMFDFNTLGSFDVRGWTFLLFSALVCACPNATTWSKRLTQPRVALFISLTLGGIALLQMLNQSSIGAGTSEFLYFNF